MKLWPFLIMSLLGLYVTGCQKAKPIGKISIRQVRLDRDLIERSSLKQDWRSVRRHILKVDGDALSLQNQAYALYWLGVSQYKLGDSNSAKRSWERALERRPDTKMTEMIRRAFRKTYSRPAHRFLGLNDGTPQETISKWVLQLGIFSLKQTAQNLVTALNSKGHRVNIRQTQFNGRTSWTVWSGPFSNRDANYHKQKLQNEGYAAILKSAEKFL